ncbi:type II secretion system protein [Sporosarcina sp. Te-1]|uniref:type II secretion system protein n=1 Tax=Sporosarcina sp. Te-1 TaxID=2818390 RepID=UPI001A9FBB84|nr:type II secretion system protein [Sporosarcina sp. Te-1]QTD41702.1 type II secretion system protein [Sporosarcina sp. Te-1]
MRTKESGFTFLELLLVLSIVAILTMLALPFGGKWMTHQAEEEALQVFIASIYKMQSHSLASGSPTEMTLKYDGAVYIITSYVDGEIGRVEFPEGMRVISTGSMRRLEFNGNGQIREPGTIAVKMARRTVEIRFQIQYGRMILYER